LAATALTLGLALPGCVIIDADDGELTSEFDRTTSARTVQGALIADETVSIWVRSNGCTSEADFSFDVDRESGTLYSVEFRREDPDTCRAAATSKKLNWSFDELNIPAGSQVSIKHSVRS
ncbi:MAG: hypothetical protein AAGI03_16030, partial [Pseudomonadota bacterium]